MTDNEQNLPPGDENVIDLREGVAALWRRKWILVLFGFLAQFVYLAIHLTSPRLYTAQTKFIFKDSQGSFGSLGGLADLVGLRNQSKTNLSDFFEVILFSDEFLGKIVDRKWKIGGDSLYLHEYWKLETYTGIPHAELRTRRKRIGTLRGNIQRFSPWQYILIEKDKRTNLVSLETRFKDGQLSYDVNQFLVELLNDHLLNNTKSQVGENRRFVQKRLEEVAADLRKSEDALLSFQMRNQSASSAPVLLELTRLRRNVEINQQIYVELKKQLEMARIEELKESPLIEVIAPAQLPLLPDRRLDIKRWAVITWLGLMLGAAVALGTAYLGRNRSMRSAAKAEMAVPRVEAARQGR